MASDTERNLEQLWEINAWGSLVSQDSNTPVAACRIVRSRYAYQKRWEVTLHVSQEEITSLETVLSEERDGLRFEGVSDRQERVVVPRLYWSTSVRGRVEAFCHELEIDVEEPEDLPEDQYLTATLTPTNLVLSEARFLLRKGTGEVEGEGHQPPWKWTTRLGEAHLSRRFSYGRGVVDGIPTSLEIPEPRVVLRLPPQHRSRDTRGLFEAFTRELDEFTRILGFLSRRHVVWANVFVVGRGKESFVEAEFHRSAGSGQGPAVREMVVNPYRMPEDGLDLLHSRYIGLDFKDALHHAFGFLIAALGEGPIEPAVINAWTALEAAVDGINRAEDSLYSVDEQTFKAFRKRISRVISAAMPGDAAKQVRGDMKAKAGELRLRPLIPRIVEVLTDHKVETSSLFPPGSDLGAALRAAYLRRSNLIHRGRRAPMRILHADVFRIHAITERLIYRLLGGDDDWLARDAYRHCEGLEGAPID